MRFDEMWPFIESIYTYNKSRILSEGITRRKTLTVNTIQSHHCFHFRLIRYKLYTGSSKLILFPSCFMEQRYSWLYLYCVERMLILIVFNY